jgi:hypothetical protein
MAKEIAPGLFADTVGEIMERETGPSVSHADAPAGGGEPCLTRPSSGTPFVMPVLDGYPVDFPEPGIYFGVPDEVYHAIPALSASGIKKLAAPLCSIGRRAPG